MQSKYFQMDGFLWTLHFAEEAASTGEAFRRYFGEFEVQDPGNAADFVMTIHPDGKKIQELAEQPLTRYSLSGGLGFNETMIAKDERLYRYAVIDAFEESAPTRLHISFKPEGRKSLKKRVAATLSPANFSIETDRVEGVMVYLCFWWIFAMALFKKGRAFVHSGTLRYGQRGIVLAGTGGCGKTSISFKMLETLKDCAYVIDDFGVLSREGYILANPKPFTIYQTDVRWGYQVLDHYIEKRMAPADRAMWKQTIRQGGNPRRRVSRTALLEKEQLSDKVAISDVFFLARSENPEVTVRDISLEELVERMAYASFREFKPLYDILANVHAVGYGETRIPTIETLRLRFRDTYSQAITTAGATLKMVSLPLNASPEKVIQGMFPEG